MSQMPDEKPTPAGPDYPQPEPGQPTPVEPTEDDEDGEGTASK